MNRLTKFRLTPLAALLGGILAVGQATAADQRQELLTLKATVINLVDALVAQGVLDKQAAAALIAKAEADAKAEAEKAAAAGGTVTEEAPPPGKNVVRVPYVPEFVKQELREQVRGELRREILTDVARKAKDEKWGTPDALPEWVSMLKPYGDFRMRQQHDFFSSKNAETLSVDNLYLDILAVNQAGGLTQAGTAAFRNTSINNNRWRERVRLGFTADINEHWSADFRLATGRDISPVSLQVTFGDYFRRFEFLVDRASVSYKRDLDFDVLPLTVGATFGRMANPFLVTDITWDPDVQFDGVMFKFAHPFEGFARRGAGVPQRDIALLAGFFPLEEGDLGSEDKWVAGGQLIGTWQFDNATKVRIATSFYDFIHETGKRNELGSTVNNVTAPNFLQKGNLLFNIANDPNLNGGLNDQLFALAADYRLLNLTAAVDFPLFKPYVSRFEADIVKNIGYDEDEILQRTGGVTYLYPIKERTLGWQLKLSTGLMDMHRFGDWQVYGAYRYVQRDAMLDALTESVFGGGGTDVKGFILGGMYGVARNIWVDARWLSSNEIDGPPLGIDTVLFDLHARF